jgi:predicted RNA-binding protein YlqC (UPF0109 family)
MAEAPAAEARDDGVVRATLEFLARSLVENADSVRVEVTSGERSTTLRLRVDPSDMGRVIGKHGHTARAIRQVVKAAAAKAGIHAVVEIAE